MLDRPDEDRFAPFDETAGAYDGQQARDDGALTPHSVETEQALLGSILLDASVLDRVATLVDPADFYEHAHRLILSAMRDRRNAGGAIDHRLVAASLGDLAASDMGGMTVAEYVALLATSGVGMPLVAADYAREIRRFADRRRIISAALTALEDAKSGKDDPRTIVEGAIGDLDAIAVSRQGRSERQVSIREAADAAFDNMQEMRSGTSKPGITTGIRDLDRVLGGGLRTGEVVILAGRPGMGKTTVALATLLAAAKNDVGSFFASLEMNDVQLGERALSAIAYARGHTIPYALIRAGKPTPEEIDILDACRSRFDGLPVRIEQKAGLTIQQIAARARIEANRYAAAGKRLRLVVIDHLGLVKASDRYSGKRYDEVTELSGTLKALSKELDVAMLVLCQLNRQVEGRPDRRPQLADLRESGAIEQDADVVLFAYREAYYLEQKHPGEDGSEERIAHIDRLDRVQSELEIIVAKQRMGPTQPVKAFCAIACNYVADLVRGQP